MALRLPNLSCLATTHRARIVSRSQPLPQQSYIQCPLPKKPQENQPTYYPGIEEEEEVLGHAFHSAFEIAKPQKMRVPGLQEFAAALWDRRRQIPSAAHDPLMHLFTEFDANNDGVLNPEELAQAFSSHGVPITAKQVQALIDEFEEGREHVIRKHEFPDFVYSLAVSNLHAKDYTPGKSFDSYDG